MTPDFSWAAAAKEHEPRTAEQVEHEIGRYLRPLVDSGQVFEVRIPETGRHGVVSGYFNDPAEAAKQITSFEGKVTGIYCTINPVDPRCHARAYNCLKDRAKNTTGDREILRRSRLYIDIDANRPAGVSATLEEHEVAHANARDLIGYLERQGWPAPLYSDSGNGAQIIFGIDLPNDSESTELVSRALEALAKRFNNDRVHVDTTAKNPSRIAKVIGTTAGKGDSTPGQPHRRSRIISRPETLQVVPREQLERLAAEHEPESKSQPNPSETASQPTGSWSLDDWLECYRGKLPALKAKRDWNNGGWIRTFECCPWNPEHQNTSAFVGQQPGGEIVAGCLHNSCSHQNWRTLRALIEPSETSGANCRKERKAAGAGRPEGIHGRVIVQPFSEIEEEEIEWLWEPYIPLGMLTMLTGDPGVGKSFIGIHLAAGVTKQKQRVLYLTLENHPSKVLLPRFNALGGDRNYADLIRAVEFGPPEAGIKRTVTLQDVHEIERVILEKKPGLIVIDPLQSFLGANVDSNLATETRPVLDALGELAERYDIAVLILRHGGKAPKDRAIYKGLGTIDFTGAVRSELYAGETPDKQKKAVVHIKSNIAELGKTLGYKISGEDETGKFYSRGYFTWTGESELGIGDLTAPEQGKDQRGAQDEAEEFLWGILRNGPKPKKEVTKAARKERITDATLRRARESLGITIDRYSTGDTDWSLPYAQDEHQPRCRNDEHVEHVAQHAGNNGVMGQKPHAHHEHVGEHLKAIDNNGLNPHEPHAHRACIGTQCSTASDSSEPESPPAPDLDESGAQTELDSACEERKPEITTADPEGHRQNEDDWEDL